MFSAVNWTWKKAVLTSKLNTSCAHKKRVSFISQKCYSGGTLKKHSLFLGHVLQRKEVGKGRLGEWNLCLETMRRPVFHLTTGRGWAEDGWVSTLLSAKVKMVNHGWTSAKFYSSTEKLLAFGCWESSKPFFLAGWTHSLFGGAIAVTIKRVCSELWLHWHFREGDWVRTG